MGDIAVSVASVSKTFRLYHDRNQTLKATLMRGRRARYETFQALDDVSLEVPAGTTFGLIGENGSGKSTLLKCMAKILRPDGGSIVVNGKISALLELGAGFHPELSGKENIYLNGAILGLGSKDIDRKYDQIVEFAGLERFIDTPVKNYSSGMYVRLGFAVAVHVDPDVLLVDEVLAVGDEEFQRRCNEKFAELRAQNKTIVVVSHALGLMRTICDELAWFEHGKVRQVGPAGEVIDTYLAEVQPDRQVEADSDGHGARWGSGEIRIESIDLLDHQGQPTTRPHTGEAVTIRIRYHAEEAIERPIFGIAIHNIEGVLVSGPNAREGGLVPEKIMGDGVVDLTLPQLMLLPGTYDLSASIYDYSLVHPYDFRQHAVRFDVVVGTPHETTGGVLALGGEWSARADDGSMRQLPG